MIPMFKRKDKKKTTDVLYLCDRKKCDRCNEYCYYTEDINHAVNFEKVGTGFFETTNSCVCCNEPIPEGRMICPRCEKFE